MADRPKPHYHMCSRAYLGIDVSRVGVFSCSTREDAQAEKSASRARARAAELQVCDDLAYSML
jgi:hypothetical protein